MKRSVFIAVAVLASGTLFFPPIAKATLVDFYFYVAPNAEQVVGAEVQSKGSGAGWLRLDTTANTIEWSIVSSNLTGAPTAAHFHGPAEPGENADVRITLDHTTNPMIGSTVVDASEELEILDNLWYLNIHTQAYPAGEIRGQLMKVVPEPATVALLAFGGLLLLRRRRPPA